MKRENRIRKNKDFKEIISKRKIVKSNELVIYYNKNNLSKTRIGISVSSKLGNAVIRNRIKRQIKAMINELIDLNKPMDYVIIAREGFKNNDFEKNMNSLKKLLTEIK